MAEVSNSTAVGAIYKFIEELKEHGISNDTADEVRSRLFDERDDAANETTRLFAKEKLSGFRFQDALDERERRAYGVLAACCGGEGFSGGLMSDGVAQLVEDLADDALRLEQIYLLFPRHLDHAGGTYDA